MVDIFSYLDYRQFLKDIYEEKKKENPQLSYRSLAKDVGFNSAGFFTNIIKGKRNISPKIAASFAKFFGLKIKEREYFGLLVKANQAKKQSLKKYYLDQSVKLKKIKFKVKDVGEHRFYEKWYYTAIRELINIIPLKTNYTAIARKLSPPIKPADVERSIKLLDKINFVKKGSDGYYKPTDPFISAGNEITAANLAKFHMETSDLAKFAIDKCPVEYRNISTLTLGLSEESYQQIVEKTRAFRKELMEISKKDTKKDRIYHLNFHIFPMSKFKKD